MAPSADCADAIPFHWESGLARMTANEASLEAAIAIAFGDFVFGHAQQPSCCRVV